MPSNGTKTMRGRPATESSPLAVQIDPLLKRDLSEAADQVGTTLANFVDKVLANLRGEVGTTRDLKIAYHEQLGKDIEDED